MSKSIQEQLETILNEYIDTEQDKIETITRQVAETTAKRLRKTSPRTQGGRKHYANGWKVKETKLAGTRAIQSIVYNATKPQLTHLLSQPHDIKNQYDEYGRSTPDPHIDNAEKFGTALYLKTLEAKL